MCNCTSLYLISNTSAPRRPAGRTEDLAHGAAGLPGVSDTA